MPRIRTIKPEFFTSEDIVNLSAFARLLYVALWCEADKEGRMAWKPKTFKMRYFPADSLDIEALCAELTGAGLVVPYGDGLAHIPSFRAHQHINPRESASQLPEPTQAPKKGTRQPRVIDASTTREGRDSDTQGGREGKGKEISSASRFAEFWETWPVNDRKQDKGKCQTKWQTENLDSIAEQVLADVELKKTSRKWTDDGGKFIEAPLVYLNNRRWEDGAGQSQTTNPLLAGAI